jgi:hypothetical protein
MVDRVRESPAVGKRGFVIGAAGSKMQAAIRRAARMRHTGRRLHLRT